MRPKTKTALRNQRLGAPPPPPPEEAGADPELELPVEPELEELLDDELLLEDEEEELTLMVVTMPAEVILRMQALPVSAT